MAVPTISNFFPFSIPNVYQPWHLLPSPQDPLFPTHFGVFGGTLNLAQLNSTPTLFPLAPQIRLPPTIYKFYLFTYLQKLFYVVACPSALWLFLLPLCINPSRHNVNRATDLFAVYVFDQKDSKYAYKTEIRSCLEHSSRPASTLWVNMMARGGQVGVKWVISHLNTWHRTVIIRLSLFLILLKTWSYISRLLTYLFVHSEIQCTPAMYTLGEEVG